METTSRDITVSLLNGLKRSGVTQRMLAKLVHLAPTSINNSVHGQPTTADNAVRFSEKLDDPKLNAALASMYFKVADSFDTNNWSEGFRNSPTATFMMADKEDDERAVDDRRILSLIIDKGKNMSSHEFKDTKDYCVRMIKLSMLEISFVIQVADAIGMNANEIIDVANNQFGTVTQKEA